MAGGPLNIRVSGGLRVACLAFLVTACAGNPVRDTQAPDWVAGTPAAYPAEHYLLGRGSAPDADQARERARADLVKTLRVAVDSRSTEQQRFIDDSGKQRKALTVERRIETRAMAVLSGVEIAGMWRDPGSGVYHALAVLERAPAARRLRERIAALDQEAMARVQAARDSRDPLAAIAAAQAAVLAQEQRAELGSLLEVVAGVAPIPRWPLARLRADRDALLARLRIAVARPVSRAGPEGSREGPADGEIAAVLAAALARAGVQVTASEEADYVLEARLDLQPPRRHEGWYWVRGELYLALRRVVDGQDPGHIRGQIREHHAWPLKAVALDAALARERIRAEAARRLREELLQVLLGFADPS